MDDAGVLAVLIEDADCEYWWVEEEDEDDEVLLPALFVLLPLLPLEFELMGTLLRAAAELNETMDFLRWYLSGAGATIREGWEAEWVETADEETAGIIGWLAVMIDDVAGMIEENDWDRWLFREDMAAFVFAAEVPIEERDNAEDECTEFLVVANDWEGSSSV